MFKLIRAKFDSHCSLSGKLIRKGDDIYLNEITKTVIEAAEYEKLMSKAVIGDSKTYFSRHSKLTTKTK